MSVLTDPFSFQLPVADIVEDVRSHFQDQANLIVSAPPGAGKSTLLPLALLDEPFLEGKKIIMLEPRRLAAKSIATRMADMIGEKVGETIGYRVRFDNKISSQTRLEVVTEGILTRRLQSDNALEDVGLVIFDEFHERSIHADLALALTRESQSVLRLDLRLLIMSATLDLEKLSKLLSAPVIESKGRMYPVEVHYTGQHDLKLLPELIAGQVKTAINKHEGDVLVFLPGQGEITRTEEILRRTCKGVKIHPLYGQLPLKKQQAAIFPDKNGTRKVVLATSIAETSLTIEGVKVVIDSGFSRVSKFDPNSGLSRLETVSITKDAADQRAGRAGRLSEGVCYRMWSKATHNGLQEHLIPEIVDADLASLMLELANWGIKDIAKLSWLTLPPKGHVAQAQDLLEELEGIHNGSITEHGKSIHALPCHPRIAHMLLWAEDENLLALACDLAALLEERDPLGKEAGIDINERIEALRRYRKGNSGGRRFVFIDKVAASYRKMFEVEEDNDTFDPYETGILLAQAFPERIACARPGNNAQFQLANGKIASAHHKDDLAYEPWLAVAHVNAREGMGKIFLASPLNPKDLAPLVKEKEVVEWDAKDGELIASKDLRIGNIVLQSKPLQHVDESLRLSAICNALRKDGAHLLNWSDEVVQWQNRVLSLRAWDGVEDWPDVSTENLLYSIEEWLSPYLSQVRTAKDLEKINLKEVLQSSLSWEQQTKLLELAPETIQVPSGSNIKLKYDEKGNDPILAVRIQEVFGMTDTPLINNGRNCVLMHLLSPAQRPVQVTNDLKNFWENTYFEVRKDLKGRYPKHHWPDNPLEEQAIRGVKRKK